MVSILVDKLEEPSMRLEVGNVLASDEREYTALDHKAGKVTHYRLCFLSDDSIAKRRSAIGRAVGSNQCPLGGT